MKRLIAILAVLAFVGVGCPSSEGDTIISGSTLRPDNYPGGSDVGPPPTDMRVFTPSLASDGSPLPDGAIVKIHRVGVSTCPDPFPSLVLPWPDGAVPPDAPPTVFYPETEVPWLDLPETVLPGEPFTPEFNCRIMDRSPHSEGADVLFRIEGHMGGRPDDVVGDLETYDKTYNLPVEVKALRIELEIE